MEDSCFFNPWCERDLKENSSSPKIVGGGVGFEFLSCFCAGFVCLLSEEAPENGAKFGAKSLDEQNWEGRRCGIWHLCRGENHNWAHFRHQLQQCCKWLKHNISIWRSSERHQHYWPWCKSIDCMALFQGQVMAACRTLATFSWLNIAVTIVERFWSHDRNARRRRRSGL